MATVLLFSCAALSFGKDEAPLAQALIQNSGITASVAIRRALQDYPGIVFDYELEDDDDSFIHEIEIVDLDKNQRHKIKISAADGEILSVSTKRGSAWFKDHKDARTARIIHKHGFSVLEALDKLPEGEHILPSEVEFKDKHGVQYFEVEFFGPNGKEKMLVDLATRNVIPQFRR
jgi:hypothetical protein